MESHPSTHLTASFGIRTPGALVPSDQGRAPGAGADLPVSARHVLAALREGPRTYRQLLTETRLPGRTVRWAVRRLRDADLVDARTSLRDGRQTWFFVRPDNAPKLRPRLL